MSLNRTRNWCFFTYPWLKFDIGNIYIIIYNIIHVLNGWMFYPTSVPHDLPRSCLPPVCRMPSSRSWRSSRSVPRRKSWRLPQGGIPRRTWLMISAGMSPALNTWSLGFIKEVQNYLQCFGDLCGWFPNQPCKKLKIILLIISSLTSSISSRLLHLYTDPVASP